MSAQTNILSDPVGIIGAGSCGLINAHVLIQDGFSNVEVITRDRSVGGVWAKDRVYPGLEINNVHGEFRFSSLEMPPPMALEESGGHLTGVDMCNYMEKYYDTFLKDKVSFKFNTEVLNVSRDEKGVWIVKTENIVTGNIETCRYFRLILATGGCSEPKMPECFSAMEAEKVQYRGIVIHSSQFRARLDDILKSGKPGSDEQKGAVVVIGGGKSAQDICKKLTEEGLKVTNVFETSDVFLAAKKPLPTFIRKSRFLSILSPHIHLRTRLEWFLHKTTLGGKITRFIWDKIGESSFDAFEIPKNSPLRKTHSLFWGVRTSDEGVVRPNSYHALVTTGKIDLIAPARAVGFAPDGHSILLDNGQSIVADTVILATGYKSSWTRIFTEKTAEEIGINRYAPTDDTFKNVFTWDYTSLVNPPEQHADNGKLVTSIYRGLVPAKNILRRDFVIAGALFTANPGYTGEVTAHWTSSYFQGHPMRIPQSVEEAKVEAEHAAAWMRTRFPNMLAWANESYSGSLDFWTWPQAVDDLLEDMYLPIHRSGRNWLTWPFMPIDLKEIINLGEERRQRRLEATVVTK